MVFRKFYSFFYKFLSFFKGVLFQIEPNIVLYLLEWNLFINVYLLGIFFIHFIYILRLFLTMPL